jgi:hypothetical protein
MKGWLMVQVLQQDDPDRLPKPILTSSDPDAIAAVGRVLAEKLGVELPRVIRNVITKATKEPETT